MQTITLNGISHKGKRCVAKKGPIWEIHARTEKVLFNPEVGPWLYIAPYGETYLSKNAMWIKEHNDPDFSTIIQTP